MKTNRLKMFALAVMLFVVGVAFSADVESGLSLTMAVGLVATMKQKGVTLTEEQEKFINEFEGAIDTKNANSFADIQKQVDEYKEAVKKQQQIEQTINITKDQVDKIAEAQNKMLAQQQSVPLSTQKTVHEKLTAALVDKSDDLKRIKDNKHANTSFEVKAFDDLTVKAPATMSRANYTGGTIGLTTWDGEVADIPTRQPFMRQLVSVRPIASQYVAWAEKTARDGAVNVVSEGAPKPQIDFDWVERSAKVQKIAGFIKITKEALADVPNAAAEVNRELITQVLLKLDQQILAGSGVEPELKGILQYAPTLSVAATVLAAAPTTGTANNFDVLRVAAWFIQNAGLGAFQPDVAVINPIDAAVMDISKTDTGGYIMPPFGTANGQNIAGLRVVTNPLMPAGTFLVGDFRQDVLGVREEVNIQVGYENDDFTKNLVTILAEMRAVNYIKQNNVAAFVQGTFATVRGALNAA